VRTSSFALACALLALSAVPSAAEIRIEDARIAAGELRITGRVSKGGEVVVLDEDISVRADRTGRFSFRVPYMPQRNCTVTLKAGDVLFIPAGTVHSAKNVGSGNGAELATYIVEKGRPLVALAE